jgi:hypothetical protein
MTLSELQQAIEAIDTAVRQRKGMRMTQAHRTIMQGGKVVTQPDVLTLHRLEQINRILRWAYAHWDEFEPQLMEWRASNENDDRLRYQDRK